MKKNEPTYAQLKYQLKERTQQADQYHKNWIEMMSEVNKLKLKLNEAQNEIKKQFVINEALKTALKSLLECV